MATFDKDKIEKLSKLIQDTLYYQGYTDTKSDNISSTTTYPAGKEAYNSRRADLLKYVLDAQKQLEDDNSNQQEVYNEVSTTLTAISKGSEIVWEGATGQTAFTELEGEELQKAVEQRAALVAENIPVEEAIIGVVKPNPNSGVVGLADQTAPSETSTDQTAEEKAADERLTAQCILIDIIPEISQKNASFRTVHNNVEEIAIANTICMTGDTNYFSSYVNGSDKKGKFLDFTTAQLSSLTPIIKLYKVIQQTDGTTKDYLIPFSTHAAWRSGKTTYGTVEDLLFNENRERPMDVGIKSFSWTFEGSNPVSARKDISAKLVLFSNNLNNLAETFEIYDNDGIPSCFRYVDLILRSGKKFTDEKQYNPQYYAIKVVIGWKSENTDLFDDKQLESLNLNTSTMLLTLIDHNFNFAQDGTLTLTLDYRAYFEGLLFSEGADILTSKDDFDKKEEAKQKVTDAGKVAEEQKDQEEPSSDSSQTQADKNLETARKEYSDLILEINKRSYSDIITALRTKKQIYAVGINVANYNLFKTQLSSKTDITQQSPAFIEFFSGQEQTIDDAIKNATKAVTGDGDENAGYNPNLAALIPTEKDGNKYITYFYLGDLINYIISKVYTKISQEPNKPRFIFGSALYRSRNNQARIARVNILDIPVSIEWFTDWFANTIISQKKTEYQLLYFLRDICSKLINKIMSSACDKSGVLRLQNKFNTVNFFVKKNEDNEDPIFLKKVENMKTSLGDITVQDINKIIQENAVQYDTKDTSQTNEYIAIYCYDASTPVNVNCDEDLKKGIYHFYFGRDRGLVKNINFTRSQVTGLRELNYLRESSGRGLEQLMVPYDVDMKMVGNNLFINGMMIFINPSGFGRKVGQPNENDSISYQLKLGGYHTIYRIESTISTSGFETNVKARWTGSGSEKKSIVTNTAKDESVAKTGNTKEQPDPAPVCQQYDSGFEYGFDRAKAPEDPGARVTPTK